MTKITNCLATAAFGLALGANSAFAQDNVVSELPPAVDALPEAENPFSGTSYEDGKIRGSEVEGHRAVIFTREQAELIIAAGEAGTLPKTIESIKWEPVEGDFAPVINGKPAISITDEFGAEFCGGTASAYIDGVNAVGLNAYVLNDEGTGPASCESLLGTFVGPENTQ